MNNNVHNYISVFDFNDLDSQKLNNIYEKLGNSSDQRSSI